MVCISRVWSCDTVSRNGCSSSFIVRIGPSRFGRRFWSAFENCHVIAERTIVIENTRSPNGRHGCDRNTRESIVDWFRIFCRAGLCWWSFLVQRKELSVGSYQFHTAIAVSYVGLVHIDVVEWRVLVVICGGCSWRGCDFHVCRWLKPASFSVCGQ